MSLREGPVLLGPLSNAALTAFKTILSRIYPHFSADMLEGVCKHNQKNVAYLSNLSFPVVTDHESDCGLTTKAPGELLCQSGNVEITFSLHSLVYTGGGGGCKKT